MKIINHFYIITLLGILSIGMSSCQSEAKKATEKLPEKMKALIIDGENNHGGWPKTTVIMQDYLLQTGLFDVDVARKEFLWLGPHNDNDPDMNAEKRMALLELYPIPTDIKTTVVEEPQEDPNFAPDFSKYDVVISNLGWKASAWPMPTQKAFEEYMAAGGGLVVVHAADNSWGEWTEFNKMIGLGGWGGRSEKSGPYVYYDDQNQLVRDTTAGGCGSHGAQQDFVMTVRNADHPITKGLPAEWLHGKDELYDRLRGPAENMTVLATAYSDVEGNRPPWNQALLGSGRHEPMLFTIEYGKGRTFHTALGHADYSMESVGFISTFQRGVEWAATGQVTQSVPEDFPTANEASHRAWKGSKE